MPKLVLALDQGTTSSRAILFGHDGRIVAAAQQEFEQILPSPGHVEHDPEAIWSSQLAVAKDALERASVSASEIAAVGIANQRETTLLWERDTGRPVHNAGPQRNPVDDVGRVWDACERCRTRAQPPDLHRDFLDCDDRVRGGGRLLRLGGCWHHECARRGGAHGDASGCPTGETCQLPPPNSA
jgi:hypothetical protein